MPGHKCGSRYLSRLSIAVMVYVVCLFDTGMLRAQSHESLFGEVRMTPVADQYERSTSIDCGDSTLVCLWSPHQRAICLITYISQMNSPVVRIESVPIDFDDLLLTHLSENTSCTILLLHKQNSSLSFLHAIDTDPLRISSTVPLPVVPEKVVIGDYNNDSYPDVLVYGKNGQGLLPLINDGKGHFRIGKIIAPLSFVGAAGFAQVNNDNLVDLIIWDWVKSELHVLYGVGRGRFIDQSIFPVHGDVDQMQVVPMGRESSINLMMTMLKTSEIQLWEGNDYGDFHLKQSISLPQGVVSVKYADINRNGLKDILLTTQTPSLQILLNNDQDPFADRLEYAAGTNPVNVHAIQSPNGITSSVVVYDRDGRRMIEFLPANVSASLRDSIYIATGISPDALISADFNDDGIADIALINSKSPSLSFYWGRKSALPYGPTIFGLSGEPNRMTYHSSTDTTLQLVFSFKQQNQLSFFSLDAANNAASNAFIGCEGSPAVLTTSINDQGKAEFTTFNTSLSEGNSISFYEQLSTSTFIERTFRLTTPDSLIGAAIADVNNNMLPDIVYAYRSGDTSVTEVAVAFGDTSHLYKQRMFIRDITLPISRQIFLYALDVNKDSLLDLVAYVGDPVHSLYIAKGKKDGIFGECVQIASGIRLNDRSDIQYVDVDGDGLIDIVMQSQNSSALAWCNNLGDFKFSSPEILYAGQPFRHFVIADINGDGKQDLCVSIQNPGVLKIISGTALGQKKGSIH